MYLALDTNGWRANLCRRTSLRPDDPEWSCGEPPGY